MRTTAGPCWPTASSVAWRSSSPGGPEIFPVNFLIHDGGILFRTGEGTKLTGANDQPVAFEVDDYDPMLTGDSWSVIVKGTARLIPLEAVPYLPAFPWHAAADAHLLRIEPAEVSGRRYVVGFER